MALFEIGYLRIQFLIINFSVSKCHFGGIPPFSEMPRYPFNVHFGPEAHIEYVAA
jgi:hypothetical protein